MISLKKSSAFFCLCFAILEGSNTSKAANVPVPNASFESPVTPFADIRIDAWQQEPYFTNQESGLFSNVIEGQTPIDNCDGTQGAFLVNAPGASLFLDYDAVDWSGSTHAFTATYVPGQSYTFTAGVIGGTNLSIPMQEGTLLQLGMYYRDNSNNIVTIASTIITNSGSLFPSPYHLVDFHVYLPIVQTNAAWAGKHIGLQFSAATVNPELFGAYWDLDNVRLTTGPALTARSWTNGNFTMGLESYPGSKFEILATTNITTPGSNWVSIGTVTNVTGTTSFTDGGASGNQRYYRAHQVP